MNLGLINGLSGKALLLFLSRKEKNTNKALKLLDHIAENIFFHEDYSFNNGIVGFGWLIAFLHHEKYIDINSDEVLEEVDDQIYKFTLQEVSKEETNADILLGLINYHIIRHRNKNPNEQYYKKFIHQECFNLMVDKLMKYLEKITDLKKITKEQFHSYCKILLKLSYSSQYIKNKSIDDHLIRYIIFPINFLKKNTSKINLYQQEIKDLYFTMKNKKFQILITEFEKIHSFNFEKSYINTNKTIINIKKIKNSEIIYFLNNIVK